MYVTDAMHMESVGLDSPPVSQEQRSWAIGLIAVFWSGGNVRMTSPTPRSRQVARGATILCMWVWGAATIGDVVAEEDDQRKNAGALDVSLTLTGAQIAGSGGAPPQYSDDQKSIALRISADDPNRTFFVDASLLAISVEGYLRNALIEQEDIGRLAVKAGQPAVIQFKAEGGGTFEQGKYRVELDVLGYQQISIPFEVVQTYADAQVVPQTWKPRRFNVALRAFGASIVSPDPSGEEKLKPVSLVGSGRRDWEAVNLIDGVDIDYEYRFGTLECRSCGWRIDSANLPSDIVIRLAGEERPNIEAVILQPYGGESVLSDFPPPRSIEVAVSAQGDGKAFQVIATARMQLTDSAQAIRFESTQARRIRVRLLDVHGDRAYLGEIKVLEAAEPSESVLADAPRNLVSPDLGGVLVYSSSVSEDLAGLIDGVADETVPSWHTSYSTNRSESSVFPQDIVLAFRDDREAYVDRVEISPVYKGWVFEKDVSATWPRDIAISVSSERSPSRGFREVGRYTMEPVGEFQSFEVAERARFIRIRILSAHGDKNVIGLGEVRVIEGSSTQRESILTENADISEAAADAEEDSSSISAFDDPEPNDVQGEAVQVALGQSVSGHIGGPDDVDQYRFDLALDEPATFNLELLGPSGIRTALELYSPNGERISRFDPGQRLKDRERFSWHLNASGDYRVLLAQPPASVVLVWDASGSMEGSTDDLERAVRTFVRGMLPGERANMVRFSADNVEVLLPDFSDDGEAILAAMDGKFSAVGGTPLYDALVQAMDLIKDRSGNRAVILLSDGLDSSSKSTDHAGLWEMLAGGAESRIYIVGLGASIASWSDEYATTGKRLLRHVAAATGGQVVFTEDSAELETLYEQIGRELRKPAAYTFVASMSERVGNLAVEAADEELRTSVLQPEQVALILDASGSMRRELDDIPMIDSAKSVLSEVVDQLPDDSLVSLRVFGHRVSEGQEGDCEDSEALVPFVPLDRARIRESLDSVSASGGTTLITHSLRQVIRDFGDVEGWKLVVLVTDGEEECEPDIASVLTDAEARGIDLSLSIVGFALAEEALKAQLTELASMTGGSFFDAGDASALRREVRKAVAIPYEVYDAAGASVFSGRVGDEASSLPVGTYAVTIQTAVGDIEVPEVEITDDSTTRIRLRRTGEQVDYEVN